MAPHPSAQIRPPLRDCVLFWDPHLKRATNTRVWPGGSEKAGEGAETQNTEESWKDLELFSLEWVDFRWHKTGHVILRSHLIQDKSQSLYDSLQGPFPSPQPQHYLCDLISHDILLTNSILSTLDSWLLLVYIICSCLRTLFISSLKCDPFSESSLDHFILNCNLLSLPLYFSPLYLSPSDILYVLFIYLVFCLPTLLQNGYASLSCSLMHTQHLERNLEYSRYSVFAEPKNTIFAFRSGRVVIGQRVDSRNDPCGFKELR